VNATGIAGLAMLARQLAGLATVAAETVRMGTPTIKVECFQITDVGRRAIAELQP
jgi:hypothetical protein